MAKRTGPVKIILVIAFVALLSTNVATAVDGVPKEALACVDAGGTWDTDHMRPNGRCVHDTSDKCAARGGQWTRVCYFQGLACVTPISDGGKACTSSSQCERGCLDVGNRPDQSGFVTGQCRRDDNPCGSFMR